MSTLVYAPGVEVLIYNHEGRVIDLSDDVISGNLQLTENEAHAGSMMFANERRKYDGLFWPNDRIVIRMKRVKWLPILTGYLTSVPWFSVYPANVNITFSCTLKRLHKTLFDEKSPEYWRFHNARMGGRDLVQTDSGLGRLLTDFLVEVAGWNQDTVHVSELPSDWVTGIAEVYRKLAPLFEVKDLATMGSLIVPGTKAGTSGARHPDNGKGYGILPTVTPRVGLLTSAERQRWEREWASKAPFKTVANGPSPWGIMARWPFATLDLATGRADIIPNMTAEEQAQAVAWHRGSGENQRRIVLYNPASNTAYGGNIGAWGPLDSSQYDILVSEEVLKHLQVNAGDIVQMRWGEDEPGKVADLGPIVIPVEEVSPAPSSGNAVGLGPNVPASSGGGVSLDGMNLRWQALDLGPETNHPSAGASQPHVVAAWDFIKANWPSVRLTSSSRSRGQISNETPTSYHLSGSALDISHPQWNGPEGRKILASIMLWFVRNPNVFGLQEAIYQYQGVSAGSNGANWWSDSDHGDHVHLGFLREPYPIGSTGNGWPESSGTEPRWQQIAPDGFSDGTVTGPSDFGTIRGGNQLIRTTWNWSADGTPLASTLSGPRRLLNDAPVMGQVKRIAKAAQRSFCSAPNGDFVAWYPDYFGKYGKLGAVDVELIEVFGFTLRWTDDNLLTHVFVTGNVGSMSLDINSQPGNAFAQVNTHGIATIEFPDILQFVAGVQDHPLWSDTNAVFQRFGARASHRMVGTLSTREAEFFTAIYDFMHNWASQYTTSIGLSFMPELYPGMMLRIPEWGIQFYVKGVQHDWSYEGSQGFTTTATIVAPSTIGEEGRGRWLDLTNNAAPIVTGGLQSQTQTQNLPGN